MICIKCGTVIENGNRFCSNCGEPVPETITCPNCKNLLRSGAKFCDNCGFKLLGNVVSNTSSNAGLTMGDKNVIAGDVKGEEYNISGGATIIRNEDETRKVMTCHICGKIIPIVNGFRCPSCGEFVCTDCFDISKGVCKNCIDDPELYNYREAETLAGSVIISGKVEMSLVIGAEFLMGKNETAHKVFVNNFYLATKQVTQELFESVMNYNPSVIRVSPNNPVDSVSWYEAVAFCNLLSKNDGLTPCYICNGTTDISLWGEINSEANDNLKNIKCDFTANGYRLPTEAEWEYAARDGIVGIKNNDYNFSGSNILDEIAWYGVNSEKSTHGVALKKSNRLGIFDMCGNLWEWCWDWFGDYNSDFDNPKGPSTGVAKIRRGGSWLNNAEMCSVIVRSSSTPSKKFNINGFRVCKKA